MRIALVVGRDLSPGRAWGIVLQDLLDKGHHIVAGAQQLPASADRGNGNFGYERFPRDVTNDYYLSIPLDEECSTSFSSYTSQPLYPQTHAVLMGMLSRRDSTGTFRVVDREVVLRRLQMVLLSQLKRAQPSLIVFEETPHEVVDFALYRLAEWLKIPVLFFQPSLVGPQVIARTSLDEILEVKAPLIGPADFIEARQRVKEISFHAIAKLESGGGTALLDRQKRVDGQSSSGRQAFRAVRHSIQRLFKNDTNRLVNLTGHTQLREGTRRFLELMLERSLRRSLSRTVAELPDEPREPSRPFALFALHYEPERTNMPEGLPYLSQLDAVIAARQFLPPEITLLVKEHYAQQSSSLRGYVGRSSTAYDFLRSVPGIEVLGVKADARSLTKRAECIFTMTGKIAIEAAFLGTPAIYFGQPWWKGLPGSHSFDSLKNWSNLAKSRNSKDGEVQHWFERQVSSRLLVGLGGTSPEKYSNRISALPREYEQLEAESIKMALQEILER